MIITEGEKWINDLKRKWVLFSFFEAVIISLTVSTVITALAVHFLGQSFWIAIPAFLATLTAVSLIKQYWKINSFDVSRYLNNRFPELEESTSLILKPEGSLSLLERLQAQKVAHTLKELPPPNDHLKKVKQVLVVLLAAIIISFIITKIPFQSNNNVVSEQQNAIVSKPVKENILPQISSYNVTITPPAYTGNRKREQKQFSFKAESGALVKWHIKTNVAIKSPEFIFNDKEHVKLKPANADSTIWTFSKPIEQSGFYQVNLDGKLSELYQIEAVADLPVSIKLTSPKIAHSTIDFGQPQQVRIAVSLLDDYSITKTYISATMASGKGEAVSFKEQTIAFNNSPDNKRQFLSEKIVDMKALGMKPGDELYFFIKAFDNHGQESRSDIYFVSIQDTSELMSLVGMSSGVNLVPEYFRSQRQIIMDTEKLLKEKSSLSADEFNSRSNNLGIDQKLLRLRYGKFLGEENETDIGEDHHEEGNSEETPVFGDTKALLDKFTHHTDNAEDATFYEPKLKAQLKATLTEMWNSELRLRTYKPQDALPYEYKALRLLKELQQDSRAYVAKTTVKVTALKPEKRLSGELGKIIEPVKKGSFEQSDDKNTNLKTTLAFLESLKTGTKMNASGKQLVMDSEKYLINAAATNPSTYLSALTAIKRIGSAKSLNVADISTAENGIRKLIGAEKATPQVYSGSPATKLSQSYFNNLKKINR